MKTVEIRDEQLQKVLKGLEALGTNISKELLKLALLLNTKIKQRVQTQGRDVSGSTMRYGSAKYKKYRKASGRSISYKDLTFSGRMWNSLTATKTGEGEVKMFFGGKEEMLKASGNQERDEFFGISQVEEPFIGEYVSELVRRALAV